MALTTDQTVKRRSADEIVGFSPRAVRAPFALHCAAFFVDYIVVILAPVLGLVFDLLIGGEPAKVSNNTAWLIAFLLGVSDVIILPSLSGQTLGMMLTGLRIVKHDGRDPGVGQVILRNTIGYLATLLSLGLGFLLGAVTPSGRMLHDYVAGTNVIYAKKRALK